MVLMRLGLKCLRFHKENLTILVIQVCMVKSIKFQSRNKQVLRFIPIITKGKASTVENLNKPEIRKCFCRSKIINIANQKVILIPNIQEYPDMQGISTSHYLV